ncbi:MAG: phosphonate ABC transporter ATP-binding protein [Eggerthellaceae bacterium]|nr:phosphonate ABC transporter ATP-binding protein [Eggerthellaceae bacterium]
MEQRQELLTVEHLTKSYDGKGKALHDVSLSLRRGEFVTVIGPSGAGKSTFLRCINRLIDASEGSIVFDGREITSMNKRQMREARRDIGMIFQHYNLVHRATAIENVLQGRLGYLSNFRGIFGLYSEEDKRSAFELLDKMGLAEFAYQRADQLSGGQQQRVGIARALVQDPLLMLCDEPIASLDPKSSRVTMEMLRWVSDELGVACLVNLHQVDYAIEYSDRIVALKKGVKVFDGTPDELDAKTISDIYGTPYVHEGAYGVEEENAGAQGAGMAGAVVRGIGAEGESVGVAGAAAAAGGSGVAGAGMVGVGVAGQGVSTEGAAEFDRAVVAAVIEEAKAVTRANAGVPEGVKAVARANAAVVEERNAVTRASAGKSQLRTGDAPHVEVGA